MPTIVDLFNRSYEQMAELGYFDEAFGSHCVDLGFTPGSVADVSLEILLSIRKNNLWPIHEYGTSYDEDDLFDVIEFLYQHVSKPVDGNLHNYGNCGMHWHTFSKQAGQKEFRNRMNQVLMHYKKRFELSENGEILNKPEAGFEAIFRADIPTNDDKIRSRIDSAVRLYLRHRASIDDRRQAVRELCDVFEYLRPRLQAALTRSDESDLFNIANNFGIRHHNESQKTDYDVGIWLSWMFYFYLATIHVALRKLKLET
ncbi:hypothetical protein [Pseudoxanthomonas sp. 10H]|uniref:hypothetical protein n=1 Tax=Pseudoxanthomonas sp. 10H TaxID=3242729 RepID=UPI0035585D3E